MLKRIFDVTVIMIALPIMLPLMAIIAVAVMRDTHGPVLYRGVRAGLRGKPFKILKFRTMIPNAEQMGGGTTALNDSRITRVGAFLRKYKLDEIPQLFNVLKGDMSLVGPRPELLQYTERYTKEEAAILSVRPGITDYSSLEFSALDECVGPSNADEVYETRIYPIKNQLRLKYVNDSSFFVDLKILFMTIGMLLKKLIR